MCGSFWSRRASTKPTSAASSPTAVKPETNLEKSLFTVDELTGIVHAYALMRPEKMDGMSVKSFKKKYKDLKFAAKCDREVINRGFEMLGLEPSVVMQACIDGMTAHKEEIGL